MFFRLILMCFRETPLSPAPYGVRSTSGCGSPAISLIRPTVKTSSGGSNRSWPSISNVIGSWSVTMTSPVGQAGGRLGCDSSLSCLVAAPPTSIEPQRAQDSSPGLFKRPHTGQVIAACDSVGEAEPSGGLSLPVGPDFSSGGKPPEPSFSAEGE